MQIAVVSGKGGAGKTTLATRLFMSSPGSVLLDCDTEEPNASLYLDIESTGTEEVEVAYPLIYDERCVNCGACAEFCAFGAILSAPKATFAMAEKCHDCGGCALVCSRGAITWGTRPIGTIRHGTVGSGDFAAGELNIGEYSGVKIIRRLRDSAPRDRVVWIDGPPGTACSAVAAVEDAGFAVLVGEPTPFGVSDMAMAAEMLRDLHIPFGVVVNKAGIGDDGIYDFCRRMNLEVLGEIPFERSFAEALSGGLMAGEDIYQDRFGKIADSVLQAARSVPPEGVR